MDVSGGGRDAPDRGADLAGRFSTAELATGGRFQQIVCEATDADLDLLDDDDWPSLRTASRIGTVYSGSGSRSKELIVRAVQQTMVREPVRTPGCRSPTPSTRRACTALGPPGGPDAVMLAGMDQKTTTVAAIPMFAKLEPRSLEAVATLAKIDLGPRRDGAAAGG